MQKSASKMTSNDSFLNNCMFMHDNINFFWECIMKNEKKKKKLLGIALMISLVNLMLRVSCLGI